MTAWETAAGPGVEIVTIDLYDILDEHPAMIDGPGPSLTVYVQAVVWNGTFYEFSNALEMVLGT